MHVDRGPQVAMSACKLSTIGRGGHCSSADWSVPHADHDSLGAVRKQFVSLAATWKAVPRLLQHVANKYNMNLFTSEEIGALRSVLQEFLGIWAFLALCPGNEEFQ